MSAAFYPVKKYFRWAFVSRRCLVMVAVYVLNHCDGRSVLSIQVRKLRNNGIADAIVAVAPRVNHVGHGGELKSV